MSARLTNAAALSADIRRLTKAVEDGAFRGIVEVAEELTERTVASIVEGSIPMPSPQHVHSRPGEPPNVEWGFLHSNIAVSSDKAILTAAMVAQAPYAPDLEFGTAKMAPRPFMRPMAAAVAGPGERAVADSIRGALSRFRPRS